MKQKNMPLTGQEHTYAENQDRENADMPNSVNLMGGNREFIDSQELLIMVNEARNECGEPPVRNNKFIEKIEDELAGEYYTKRVVQKANKTEMVVIGMLTSQALRVSARESKAVRRSLVDKLEARHNPAPEHRELSTMEILQIAMKSEQGRIEAEERAARAERTKAQISNSREASALGRLSAATRKCRELEERLGESVKHATITKVEKKTGGKYGFMKLRRWCRENGVEAIDVPDSRYGSVKSWPAGAWLSAFGIDLRKLFGGTDEQA